MAVYAVTIPGQSATNLLTPSGVWEHACSKVRSLLLGGIGGGGSEEGVECEDDEERQSSGLILSILCCLKLFEVVRKALNWERCFGVAA